MTPVRRVAGALVAVVGAVLIFASTGFLAFGLLEVPRGPRGLFVVGTTVLVIVGSLAAVLGLWLIGGSAAVVRFRIVWWVLLVVFAGSHAMLLFIDRGLAGAP